MAIFQIQARRVESKTVTGMWESSGVEVPGFSIDAPSAAAAAEGAHTVLGVGLTSVVQTTVTAYGVTDDGDEDMVTSVQYWAGGKKTDPTEVKRSYVLDWRLIDGDPFAEGDADTVTWFTADGGVYLSVKKTPRDKWAIDATDYVRFFTSDYRRRFATPDEALEFAQRRAGAVVLEVSSWD